MSFKTASAILRGKWLIEPTYAKAQLPLLVEMIKGSASVPDNSAGFKDRLEYKQSVYLPKQRHIAAIQSDVYSVSPYTSMDRMPNNSIAMVDILGPILKYGDYCTYGTVEYSELMIRLGNSDRIKGIILNIDSPGGQADGTAQLAQTIREVSQRKPVIGIIQDGYAASAGMWVAAACQELYVTQASDQVGSIGAYTTIYDFAKYFEDYGIKVHDIYAPQSVDKNKAYYDAIEGDYSLIQEDLKFLVNEFIGAVKMYRGPRLNTATENPFTGKMYRAAEAKKIGLIDGVKPLADVIKRIEQLVKTY